MTQVFRPGQVRVRPTTRAHVPRSGFGSGEHSPRCYRRSRLRKIKASRRQAHTDDFGTPSQSTSYATHEGGFPWSTEQSELWVRDGVRAGGLPRVTTDGC
jgi:hypothetical protein